MPQLNRKTIIGAFGILLTLTALALIAYHTTPHCTDKCDDNIEDICPGALWITSGSTTKTKIVCPWKKGTVITGLISLCLTLILMICLFLTLTGKTLKMPMAVLGAIIIPLLLVSFGLMIKDLVNGFKFLKDLSGSYSVMPGSYIVNAILMIVSVGIVAWAVKLGWMANEESAKSPNAVMKMNDPRAQQVSPYPPGYNA